MTGNQPGELIKIAVAPNEYLGQLWHGILAEEGIPAMLRASGAGTAYFSPSVLQYDIYVLAPQAEQARSILAEITQSPDAD